MKQSIVNERNQYRKRGQTAVLTIRRMDGQKHSVRFDADLLTCVKHFIWRVKTGRDGTSYACTGVQADDDFMFLHHLVHGGKPAKGKLVYFADNDWTNCKRSNLLVGDRSKLAKNSRASKNAAGLVYPLASGKWNSRGYIGQSKYRTLGPFDTRAEAEAAKQAWDADYFKPK